jgi:BirA family transcriptional regulator, biotin operon repressor / biotin---[acetyl-CoA-carboxylase] ligase
VSETGAGRPVAVPGGAWRLEVHDALPSTSDVLIRRAQAGAPEGLALLARRQTAGRGREGRAWLSPEGNLHLSILLRPVACPPREAMQWSLLAGVALAGAASELEPAGQAGALRLKWPNDLLRHGSKVAGILAESAIAPAIGELPPGLAWIVLGIGVNLRAAPDLPDGRPTATLARPEAPEAFADRLLRHLRHWHGVQAARGFAPVRAAWMALGPAPGAALTLRGAGGEPSGRYAGLDEDGALLLDTALGRRHIIAGEVAAEAR